MKYKLVDDLVNFPFLPFASLIIKILQKLNTEYQLMMQKLKFFKVLTPLNPLAGMENLQLSHKLFTFHPLPKYDNFTGSSFSASARQVAERKFVLKGSSSLPQTLIIG